MCHSGFLERWFIQHYRFIAVLCIWDIDFLFDAAVNIQRGHCRHFLEWQPVPLLLLTLPTGELFTYSAQVRLAFLWDFWSSSANSWQLKPEYMPRGGQHISGKEKKKEKAQVTNRTRFTEGRSLADYLFLRSTRIPLLPFHLQVARRFCVPFISPFLYLLPCLGGHLVIFNVSSFLAR